MSSGGGGGHGKETGIFPVEEFTEASKSVWELLGLIVILVPVMLFSTVHEAPAHH